MKDEEPVRCECGVHHDDGLMILCDVCKTWQHAVSSSSSFLFQSFWHMILYSVLFFAITDLGVITTFSSFPNNLPMTVVLQIVKEGRDSWAACVPAVLCHLRLALYRFLLQGHEKGNVRLANCKLDVHFRKDRTDKPILSHISWCTRLVNILCFTHFTSRTWHIGCSDNNMINIFIMLVNFTLWNTEEGPADMPYPPCFGIPKGLPCPSVSRQIGPAPWSGHFKGPETDESLRSYDGLWG